MTTTRAVCPFCKGQSDKTAEVEAIAEKALADLKAQGLDLLALAAQADDLAADRDKLLAEQDDLTARIQALAAVSLQHAHERDRYRAAIAQHRDDCHREYGNRPSDHSDQDAALWAVLADL